MCKTVKNAVFVFYNIFLKEKAGTDAGTNCKIGHIFIMLVKPGDIATPQAGPGKGIEDHRRLEGVSEHGYKGNILPVGSCEMCGPQH